MPTPSPASSGAQLPPRGWLIVALLSLVVCFNFVCRIMVTTMHGSILASFPVTETKFGLLTSAFLWVYAVVNPLGGFLADRFSRSWMIVASMAGWATITWLTSFVHSFEQLLVLRMLFGMCAAFNLSAGLSLVCDYHRGATRSLATGIHNAGYTIGIALGSLSGALADWRGWRFVFSVVGLAAMAYCVVVACLLRDLPREDRKDGEPAEVLPRIRFGEALRTLFSYSSFILIFMNMFFIGSIAWMILGWMPVFLQEHFHLTQGVAGLSATGYANIAGVPGMLIGGVWADRWSRTNRRARMFVIAIGFIVAAPCVLMAANTGALALAILGLILYRVLYGFADANLMPAVCEVVDVRYRATAYGILNMMSTSAAGLGIYVGGVLRDRKVAPSLIFDFTALFLVIAATLFYFTKPRRLSGNALGAASGKTPPETATGWHHAGDRRKSDEIGAAISEQDFSGVQVAVSALISQ